MITQLDNKQRILQVAEGLIQTKGYNAFSYRDIADAVGIKNASIHYHFSTKEDLGVAVVQAHEACFSEYLSDLSSNTRLSCKKQCERFFTGIFDSTYYSERKMCLGGMLACDLLTLPKKIQHAVKHFFTMIEQWLEQLLREGMKTHEFRRIVDYKKEATLILSMVEGALLLARLYQDEQRLEQVKRAVLLRLTQE